MRPRACCADCWGADVAADLKPILGRAAQRAIRTWTRRPIAAACMAGIAAAAIATTLQACMPGDGSDAAAATAPGVSDDASCSDILAHKRWTGTVSYHQVRDARSDGDYLVKYDMDVELGAGLSERARHQFRGADYLVQYYSPLPEGASTLRYTREDYAGTSLERWVKFSGTGRMQRQQTDMTEDGSSLSLTLDAHGCTYQFHLQGQMVGSGETWNSRDGTRPYPGPMWINSVTGEGPMISATSIRGSAPFPVLSRSQIEDNQLEKTSWVSEMDAVARALGEDKLGTVVVEWSFTAKN